MCYHLRALGALLFMEEIAEEIAWREGSRNSLQSAAMTAIYDELTYIGMGEPVNVEEIVSSLLEKDYEDCDYFVKAAAVYAIKYREEAIEKYSAHMVKWTFDRLNRLEQAILLLAYVHFYAIEKDISKKVVISVAVRLAKNYLGKDDYKFVNGILDNVLVRE